VLLHDLKLSARGSELETEGSVSLTTVRDPKQGRKFTGHLRLPRIGMGPIEGSNLVAGVTFDGESFRLASADMVLYGGRLVVEKARCGWPDLGWNADVRLSHLDLESLVAALGVEGRHAPSGFVRGNLRLAGRGADRSALKGEGTVKVDRGELYNLPMVAAVLNVLDIRMPRHSPVTRAYAVVSIEEEVLAFREVLLTGGSVPVHIRGGIGISDELPLRGQPVDLVFSVPRRRNILDEIPIVSWIKQLTYDRLRSAVLQVHVVGTVADYRAKHLLKPLTAPVASMWKLLQKLSPQQTGEYVRP
jgi:hypothetical protein